MIYENIEGCFIDFLANPIKNNNVIHVSQIKNFIIILTNKIPIVKTLIENRYSGYLFEQDIKKLLEKTVDKSDDFTSGKSIKHTPEALLITLENYFKVGVYFENNIEMENFTKEELDFFILDNMRTKLEYNVNRICEAHNLSMDYMYEIVSRKELWLSYYCSELLFFLKQGLLEVSLHNNKYILYSTPKLEVRLKSYWLSEMIEYNSKIADINFYYEFSKKLENFKKIPKKLENDLVDYTMDKVFSIKTIYIDNSLKEDAKYILFKKLVLFISLMECFSLSGLEQVHEKEFLSTGLIEPEFIEYFKLILKEQSLKKKTIFVYIYFNNGYFYKGTLGFKYGLRELAGVLLSKKQNELKGKDIKGALGLLFETNYILNYIKGIEKYGYKIYGEFKPNSNAKIKGYDIDLVLHDKKLNIFYFIQVKFKFSALPTYIHEQLNLFRDENFEKGFEKQLLTLKENFNDDSIRKKLRDKQLGDATLENSYFILLHNLPFLNFYKQNGVFFYEWNLLRNILQECKLHLFKDNDCRQEHVNLFPKLHKPGELVDAYYKNSSFAEQLRKKFDIYSRSFCSFNLDDREVECKLI